MLLEREEVGVVRAVERLGGMQAQEPRPPFIGLWSRVAGFEPLALTTALHDRSLVRAMAMRATLHLMSAADYLASRTALEPVMATAMRVLGTRAEGLDLDRVLPAAQALLEDEPRTFAEIRDHLVSRFPEVNDRALGYAVRTRMPLVMEPTADRWGFPATVRFTLAESWLGAPIGGGSGAEAVALRHLASFGPASAADVQVWSGLTGMAAVLEGLRPQLVTFHDEGGRELFDLPDAPRPDAEVPAPARFLPEFDNLVLAHADRSRIIADAHRPELVTKNLRVRATFLWDGFAAGTWTVERGTRTTLLTLTPFARLPKGATATLRDEAEALVRFIDPDAKAYVTRFEKG